VAHCSCSPRDEKNCKDCGKSTFEALTSPHPTEKNGEQPQNCSQVTTTIYKKIFPKHSKHYTKLKKSVQLLQVVEDVSYASQVCTGLHRCSKDTKPAM